ncbi:MAG: threonine synthase [Anaerolineales bacterium]|nr:MAG: threonine synthase [Anaerolineales bacterium]
MQSKFTGYRCSLCGRSYSPEEVIYTCPADGGNLDVILDFQYINQHYTPQDIFLSREASIWRYLPLLAVDDPGGRDTPFHDAGWTPVFQLPSLASKYNLKNLWVKDESRNPTASFKDRASAVVIARGKEINAEVIVTASTGNAGAALAGMAAAIDQKAVIFAPRTAPPAKIAQLLIFGATVYLVDGTYDNAFDLTIEASNEFGWYCRNTGYNPFTAEGKKTGALEIWEWLMHQALPITKPLVIFVSVGDGNIISGLHKGFKDLHQLGWLEVMPRIFGVQADGSAAISKAFHTGTERITPVSAKTIADSISVDLPRDGVRAVRAARDTGGGYITVKDEEIIAAIAELGKVGIFAEPAGATSLAGVVKAVHAGIIKPEDQVLAINTGSGLKDVRAAMQAIQEPIIIEPSLSALQKVIG